jgi:hypothetical protein
LKRPLDADEVSERSPKRRRPDGWDGNSLNNRRLSKQDLKRERKNERRRFARARARGEHDNVSPFRARSIISIEDEEDSTDEEETTTLQGVIHSWEDDAFTLLDRTAQSGRCASFCEMKRTPDVLARRFWMKLSHLHSTAEGEDYRPRARIDPGSVQASSSLDPSCAEIAKVDLMPSFDAWTRSLDIRPSEYARRMMRVKLGFQERPTIDKAQFTDDRRRSEVKTVYRSGASSQKSVRAKNKMLVGMQAVEAIGPSSAQQLAVLVDDELGQSFPTLGQVTYSDREGYEAAGDRTPMCKEHNSRSREEIPDPSSWSFHIPYDLDVNIHDSGEEVNMESELPTEESCICGLNSVTDDAGRVYRPERSTLRIPKLAAEPPWRQGRTQEECEALSEIPPDKTASADFLDPSQGCEYPSQGIPLRFRLSLGFELRESIEHELKGARWSE